MKTKIFMVMLMGKIWVSWWAQVKLIIQFRYSYYILHNNAMVISDSRNFMVFMTIVYVLIYRLKDILQIQEATRGPKRDRKARVNDGHLKDGQDSTSADIEHMLSAHDDRELRRAACVADVEKGPYGGLEFLRESADIDTDEERQKRKTIMAPSLMVLCSIHLGCLNDDPNIQVSDCVGQTTRIG